ncbi:nuclear factor erythroid 2-related factor 2a isoform X2 [Paramormyrops kingsleyae]|uniref:Nfe2 like bZIP transcription factor 2a n=1 Tax=Paramormyrops kingsleyae TaxID=1676925 RepID=A0A3B3QKS0_9TELE|nr:nuclear factor erythroid 2-related factor 2 isoform X2 [Paramormyrops kingsleyae]
MMEIELPKMHQSQQEMELIDILWRQDIDLGAGREVFDYSHRQKEHELQRQRQREEEERLQRLQEEKKALLAQLQLDEETGEFVPRAPPSSQQTTTPPEKVQPAVFTEEDVGTLSFDECMQLLEETFPLVEAIETSAPTLDPSVLPAAHGSPVMMGPQPQPLLSATPPPQKPLPDLEQAWMELLSIPELQCLNMQMGDVVEPQGYSATSTSPVVQEPNYPFYLPKMTDVITVPAESVCSSGYQSSFEGAFAGAVPADSPGQATLEAPDLNGAFSVESFCDMFYPDLTDTTISHGGLLGEGGSEGTALAELPEETPVKPMDISEFTLGEGFASKEAEVEFPDSDSGLSLDASPNNGSPEKSTVDDSSFGYSDSDMEEMDSNPGSTKSDYTETFPLSFVAESIQGNSGAHSQPGSSQDQNAGHPKTELAEDAGHDKPPFTKDKHRRRMEARLSRDEQRAKALQIPLAVDLIINLPVDDFNELMSKHQLNEAQLALVRDIRRRGKNKVAAQNCRKRKMESIAGLECELDSLREEKERLLQERSENDTNLRQAKQELSSLYKEVFSMLRDEEGKPYSPSEYSLQQTSDGNVYLVPRVKKTTGKTRGN